MNPEINPQEDQKWQAFLARSNPTFVGDTDLPFAFLTNTLARIKAEKKEREIFERIGLRSLFAAMAILVAVIGVSIGVRMENHSDFDPAIKSALQADEVSIS